MKKNKLFLFLIFFLINLLSFSADNFEKLKPSENLITGKLENGFEYFIFKNKKPENRASLNLVVKAGSLLETNEQQGVAHFLEHMAFNGTTKYKKNELVKYLQSLGLSFGGDLNAYTSFSETVYKLKVPTTKNDLRTAFDILKEWSSEITLDPDEVEKEKKIIMEEWRTRQGINQRVGDIQRKILYGDSWYSKRFPIGLPEIFNNATSQLLRDFYKKWYTPKNMAVIAVGDFDIDEIHTLIKETFSNLKNPVDVNNHILAQHNIKLSETNSVEIFTDPELTNTKLNILWKETVTPLNSEVAIKNRLKTSLLNSILNSRFSILAKDKNANFSYSSAYSFNLNKNTGVFAISSAIKENRLTNTITDIIENLKFISLNGISEDELNREKTNILNDIKFFLTNKDSINNETYMNAIVSHILEDNTFLDIESEYQLTVKILDTITSKDLIEFLNHILSSKYDVLITSKDDMKDSLPEKKEIETLINSILNKKNINLKFSEINTNLPELELENGQTKLIDENDEFTKLVLSNGIEVFYKETDFDKDRISFDLVKLQGSSSLIFSMYINTLFLSDILIDSGVGNIDYKSVNAYFKGKIFNVTPFINSYTQGFSISTNKDNLNESLKYFRTLIQNPKFDENIIESNLKTIEESIKNRDFSPRTAFKKEYLSLLYNNHPRRVLLELEDLKYITKNNLNTSFNNLFSNFKDFKLIVVGSIDKDSLIPILNRYFANLPVKTDSKSYIDLEVEKPHIYSKKIITKGVDKKSSVIMTFPYQDQFSIKNRTLYNAFSSLLDILLIENVREEFGGVYSISSSVTLDKLNFGENYLTISFTTDRNRVEEVIQKIKDTILKIQKGDFPENKISDIQKNYALGFETALKTNSFWNSYLNKKSLISNYEFYSPEKYNDIVNFNSIINFSNIALDINTGVEVILLPEKEE